ncbi:MAG TPA: hypothetical protein VMV18_06115, partial [bacterium]|nr:hypothetical protein [bacterium]
LGVHSSEPRLALRVRVKADGRLGDQLCVRVGDRRVFGRLLEGEHEGWRELVVAGAVSSAGDATTLDAWCFDTRGRPGPYRFDDVSLILVE